MHRLFDILAKGLALVGGAVLAGLAFLTCLSIVGRVANGAGHSDWLTALSPALSNVLQRLGPITGDYEIVEAGMAFAIFAFLPWCQLNRGHASVDILVNAVRPRIRHALTLFWEAVFALVYILIAWRLTVGAGDKARYGETSLLLQFPAWWAYAACAAMAWVGVAVCLYAVWLHARDLTARSENAP